MTIRVATPDTSTDTRAALPYATLLAFTRYVDRTGPAKAAFVGKLRRQRETGGGFNPHSQMVKALKNDIEFGMDGTHLAAVRKAVNPRWSRLYDALTAGATRYLRSLGEPHTAHLTPVNDALAIIADLPVRVSAHFGLRYDDGRVEAVRLHFDEEPPTTELVTATLHLMRANMGQILPHGEPVLVDVRRGVSHRVEPRRVGEISRWLFGEAAGFAAMWKTPPLPQ
ncbi:hypothetical protein QEZ54_16190 [Catellatospora sp. KI3]|uniref:hypothetical protein n=1 Tax=Catellatospora sp. KI3 TaxID=3041620 RepID=UPI0024821417|nr:hypothetical protein [Catellatospora sp. KI3]MDI1462512.1 hypothetical protein [Catellatospora sp. KI3]